MAGNASLTDANLVHSFCVDQVGRAAGQVVDDEGRLVAVHVHNFDVVGVPRFSEEDLVAGQTWLVFRGWCGAPGDLDASWSGLLGADHQW